MQLDFILLGVVLLFAVIGAFAGAARQLAQIAGLVLAYVSARPLGGLAGPYLARALGAPLVVGTVLGIIGVFIAVFALVRHAGASLLRSLLTTGKDDRDRSLDRGLGFILGGLKAAAILYVVICALSFIENHVSFGNKRFGISPRDSWAFAMAKEHNVFQMAQFSAAADFVRLARSMSDPKRAKRLESDPAFKSLRKDPRFQKALESDAMKRALETGDWRKLLESNPVLQLVQDPDFAARLGAAADAAEQ